MARTIVIFPPSFPHPCTKQMRPERDTCAAQALIHILNNIAGVLSNAL